MPVAPNQLETVRRVMAAHPEVNRTVDGERGKITDYVVLALGGLPWGRKDRDKDPNNNNNSDDALCYSLGDKFEIYDIINGGDGGASFDYKGTFADGENGYFREVKGAPAAPPPATGPDTSSLQAKIAILEASAVVLHDSLAAEAAARELLAATVEDLKGRLDQLEGTAARLGQPITVSGRTDTNSWHSHGVKLSGVL